MQDIRERVREKDPNANTRICFEVQAIALRRRLHTEGFQLSTIGSFTKGPLSRNFKYKLRVQNSNSHTSTQEGATITSTQEGAPSKDENTT